jgi:antitoxin ParD1/3/4
MGERMTIKPSVQLDDQSAAFVGEAVESGRYATADEVVRAGLLLLAAEEARVKDLVVALIEGEQSGEPVEFDGEAFLARMHARHAG